MISREEMENIASLSKLYLSEAEIEKGIKDMSSIVDFVNQINAIDFQLETKTKASDIVNAFREDEVEESFTRDAILSNVNGGEDGFFFLKKHK